MQHDPVFHEIIVKSMQLILDRFEKSADDYGFIDTKFNIVSQAEFDSSEPFMQRDYIFGWIQGRALESLAGHWYYFKSCGMDELCSRISAVVRSLADRLEKCRKNNGGHIYFAMTPEGKAIGDVPANVNTFADLFYGKGLFAAGALLKDAELTETAEALLDAVFEDIEKERFVSGQVSFDPKNPAARTSPDKVPEGPRMIALGALAELIDKSANTAKYADIAEKYITFIRENHLFTTDGTFCFCEDIHRTTRKPYVDNGHILCDPGHGLEFTGLAGKCLWKMQHKGIKADFIARCGEFLPELFFTLYAKGHQAAPGGIVKAVDAVSGELLNSDMPWWNLPETFRSASVLSKLYPEYAEKFSGVASEVRKFMLDGYVQSNGFCCQMRDENGRIVNVIPAVPDADPGYHTNLCLMPV